MSITCELLTGEQRVTCDKLDCRLLLTVAGMTEAGCGVLYLGQIYRRILREKPSESFRYDNQIIETGDEAVACLKIAKLVHRGLIPEGCPRAFDK